jgi:hypothetical protein
VGWTRYRSPFMWTLCENMRNVLLHRLMILVVTISIVIVSLFVSFYTLDFAWFGRAGSVMTILGLMLTIKHTILSDTRDIHKVVMARQHYSVFAPERDSDSYREHMEMARNSIRDEYIGFTLTILGTVIWGYGDLAGRVFT